MFAKETATRTTVRREPVAFSDLPGWADDDVAAALEAWCAMRPAGCALAAGARAVLGDGERARAFLEAQFVACRVVHGGDRGMVTGYYEPVLAGSRTRSARFHVPLYLKPDDLVKIEADTDRGQFNDRLTAMRATAGGKQVAYYTRAEIEDGALDGRGLEFFYLDDPVEAFFLHVQGSGVIELDDGTSLRIGYAGKNGHPYTSVGKYLIAEGEIPADQMTLDALRTWLSADAGRGAAAMRENASFIFFRETGAVRANKGPAGAAGVALTKGRSLAVDTGYHALGEMIYVVAEDLEHERGVAFRRLMVAHDVGSAIRGPERGDIFCGTGEAAGALAGRTIHAASFFVLMARPETGRTL